MVSFVFGLGLLRISYFNPINLLKYYTLPSPFVGGPPGKPGGSLKK